MGSPRIAVDLFAAFAHFVLLITICSINAGADWGSGAGVSLIMMQIVAIFAHLFYAYKLIRDESTWRRERNVYKWVEYAISATLGTVSVFLSAESDPNRSLLALLITLSITIQTVGYSLDLVRPERTETILTFEYLTKAELVQWLSAAVGQAADFGVVGAAVYARDDWSDTQKDWHFVPYIIGWSSFGILNLFVLIWYPRTSSKSDENETIELWYSILSLLAKAFVFGSTGYYL
ncbi:MAG: hypothetical protein CL678_00020 [Bdellovibrionaceae bacterium]|nr:hypothetical protein [Pseudobdellovibrionaceae bacterium]